MKTGANFINSCMKTGANFINSCIKRGANAIQSIKNVLQKSICSTFFFFPLPLGEVGKGAYFFYFGIG